MKRVGSTLLLAMDQPTAGITQPDHRSIAHRVKIRKVQRYYFDHNATTPLSPEVLEAMASCFADVYGNASSIHHFGQLAKQRLEMARRQTAALLNCRPQEVVFVSGGTEADNLALLGCLRPCQGKHVITTAIEHPAVLGACAQTERAGGEVPYAPVGSAGI